MLSHLPSQLGFVPLVQLASWVLSHLSSLLHTIIAEELLSKNEKEKQGAKSALNIPYKEIEFGRALDRGAFGEVYYGLWRGNDVAIKVCDAVLVIAIIIK